MEGSTLMRGEIEHRLARLDGDFGDPEELRAQVERMIAELEVDTRPGASQEGADSSQSVWVTVSASGAVLDVSISRRWKERLPADRLGEAVLEAYYRALEKCGAAAAFAAMRRQDSDPVDPVSPQGFDMPDVRDPGWTEWAWRTLDETSRKLQELTVRLQERAPAERTVSGPRGYVRVRVEGVGVTAVLIDAMTLAERDPDAVAMDARAALQAASETR
ncbi:MAG: hypothetical protein DIU79_03985 [Actinobacteria bacterium]|nr:MAG: hypothetical protein DIU79_03985 [Actinomycetota bacterium]